MTPALLDAGATSASADVEGEGESTSQSADVPRPPRSRGCPHCRFVNLSLEPFVMAQPPPLKDVLRLWFSQLRKATLPCFRDLLTDLANLSQAIIPSPKPE